MPGRSFYEPSHDLGGERSVGNQKRPTILQIIPRARHRRCRAVDRRDRRGALCGLAAARWCRPKAGVWRAASRQAAARSCRFPPPPRTRSACSPMPARLRASIATEGSRSGACPQPRPGLERACCAARRTRVPFVTTYHGAYSERDALKRLYNSVMARSDVVIANSRYTAELVRSATARRGDAHRRHPPRRRSRALRPCRDTGGARRGLARPMGRARRPRASILHAGAADGWKGQAVLIEAAAMLAAQGGSAMPCVVLAGDAQGRDDYVHTVARRDRETRPRRPRAAASATSTTWRPPSRRAHVAVIASIEPEAFGRTAIEAQAMGCPVIATRHRRAAGDRCWPSLRHRPSEITGWLVPPGDAAALAAALGRRAGACPPTTALGHRPSRQAACARALSRSKP